VNKRGIRPALRIDLTLLLARKIVEFSRWIETFTRLGRLRPLLFMWRTLFHDTSREGRRWISRKLSAAKHVSLTLGLEARL
jgi:hypothetical protein